MTLYSDTGDSADMSLHSSLIAIEGDRRDDVRSLLEKLNFRIDETRAVPNWEQVLGAFKGIRAGSYKLVLAVYHLNGWTHIVDPMMGLYFEDVWIENSALWKTRIFGWVCEGCSGSYGISLYQDGQRLRSVLASEGKVEEDIGAPLGEEHGTNWATASEEDVLAIAGRLGLDYGTPESGYLVFTVDWSALAPSPEQLAAFVEKCQEAARASPRWRWGGLTDSPRWQWLVLLWAVFVLIVIWALVTLDWGFWRNKLGF